MKLRSVGGYEARVFFDPRGRAVVEIWNDVDANGVQVDLSDLAAQAKGRVNPCVTLTAELRQVYESSTYKFSAGGKLYELHVGHGCPRLRELLDYHGENDWAMLTAWNPGSLELNLSENCERGLELERVLHLAGLDHTTYSALGLGPDGYAESSVLVVGITLARATRLARCFGQLALLAGDRSDPTVPVVVATDLPVGYKV